MREVLILEENQSVVKGCIRRLIQAIREEENAMAHQKMEGRMVLDQTDDHEFLQEFRELYPIPSARRKYKYFADDLEPLVQNGLLFHSTGQAKRLQMGGRSLGDPEVDDRKVE